MYNETLAHFFCDERCTLREKPPARTQNHGRIQQQRFLIYIYQYEINKKTSNQTLSESRTVYHILVHTVIIS